MGIWHARGQRPGEFCWIRFVSWLIGRFFIQIPRKIRCVCPTESILARAGNNQKWANTIKYNPGVIKYRPWVSKATPRRRSAPPRGGFGQKGSIFDHSGIVFDCICSFLIVSCPGQNQFNSFPIILLPHDLPTVFDEFRWMHTIFDLSASLLAAQILSWP